eukprot:GFKZ01000740.1.p2 GENE.GFKZ01000740.1~~GFKZ01000740.1.p2  ORF type:complete len:372 (-),score=76.55 GFKZ01000740.1:2918-4033(-)
MGDASVVNCTACRVRIIGSEARHEHYRSDLHRVNLKRKVGGLGPLTAEEFELRVSALQQSTAGQNAGARGRREWVCSCCSKRFSSQKALENHNKSRRHLDRVRRFPADDISELSTAGTVDTEVEGVEDVEDDEAVERELERRMREGKMFSSVECVFDGSVQGSVEENLEYMSKEFGFFLPYVEDVVDVEGLLRYLGQKVGIGFACVACDRGFGSVKAAQRHMVDKSHCRMTEGEGWEEEYGEFYRFGDDGWEEVEAGDAEGVDGGAAEVGEEVEMVVAGKVLGHRSLKRYYKQAPGSSVDSRAAVVANRAMKEYRLLGWEGRKVDDGVKRGQRRAARREQRFALSVGNKNYYTRKATFKQRMAVFNSGYRA